MIPRWILLAYGAAVFVWLQIEDNAVLPVVVLGATGSVLLVLSRWLKAGQADLTKDRSGRTQLANAVLINAVTGAVAGVGAALATAFLMLIKTGLHSHLFPDYPPAQMIAILQRAPVWALAGALVAMGITLGRWARKEAISTQPSALSENQSPQSEDQGESDKGIL